MLGHESYVESCSRIRRYSDIGKGGGTKYKGIGVLHGHFRMGDGRFLSDQPHSWVDLFMLRDVHIVGLALEFTEVDLWYLISWKRRLQRLPEMPDGLKRSRVVFHALETGSDEFGARRSLLQAFGVQYERYAVESGNYEAAWGRLLTALERELAGPSGRGARA